MPGRPVTRAPSVVKVLVGEVDLAGVGGQVVAVVGPDVPCTP